MVTLPLFFLFSVSAILPTTNGYSNGATTATCYDMRPQHGVPAKVTPSPYIVKASKSSYRGFEEIEVSISGTEYFTGFLLEAISTDKDTHVGYFQTDNSPDVKSLGCGEGDAATNSRKIRMTSIIVRWRAPTQTVGNVQMTATVIKDEYTFWLKIKSPILAEILPTLPPNYIGPQRPLPPGGPQPGLYPQKPEPVSLIPPSTESFNIQWTYIPCSNPPEVEFDVTADISDVTFGNSWIAIAFSRDEYMGDDSVVECFQTFNNQIAFRASYNQLGVKNNILIPGTNIGVTPLSGTSNNGKLNCRFRRAVRVLGETRIFDLTAQRYRLLVARGVTTANGIKLAHNTLYKRSPLVSTEFINFQESGSLRSMK